jgi:hypothetical protein
MSPSVDDYSSPERFISLSNGSVALLNSCYDLFGAADVGSEASTRRHAIQRLIHAGGQIKAGDAAFRDIRQDCLADFATLVDERQPDVLVAAIHHFEMPGRDGYWQRHGIARASARFKGALVIGAAHFEETLPGQGSTLAACGVPRRHLTAGVSRLAHSLAPINSLAFRTSNGIRAVLRLFDASSSRKPATKGKVLP